MHVLLSNTTQPLLLLLPMMMLLPQLLPQLLPACCPRQQNLVFLQCFFT